MNQVWKYIIKPDKLEYEIPQGGIVLVVGEQFGEICIWVEVNPLSEKEKRLFKAYGTGFNINEGVGVSRTYHGSAKLELGYLVFHVYEYTTE